jgi:hypothetical protein
MPISSLQKGRWKFLTISAILPDSIEQSATDPDPLMSITNLVKMHAKAYGEETTYTEIEARTLICDIWLTVSPDPAEWNPRTYRASLRQALDGYIDFLDRGSEIDRGDRRLIVLHPEAQIFERQHQV